MRNAIESSIAEHIPRIRGTAKKYAPRLLADEDDLYSAGLVAFWHAAKRYDGRDGVTMWTHAYPRVVGAMSDAANPDRRRRSNPVKWEQPADDQLDAIEDYRGHSDEPIGVWDATRDGRIASVTWRSRVLLAMVYVDGMTVADAARSMGVNPACAGVWFRHAVAKWAKWYQRNPDKVPPECK